MVRLTASRKGETPGRRPAGLGWAGLQFRMTVSYALTTMAAVLLIEILFGAVILAFVVFSDLPNLSFLANAHQTAKLYALAAAVQTDGGALDPRITFAPSAPASIALPRDLFPNEALIPYVSPGGTPARDAGLALVIAPDGRVLASSDPAHYPPGTPAAQLLPGQAPLIAQGLTGGPGGTTADAARTHIIYAVEPVWSRDHRPIGAVYTQIPALLGQQVLGGFTMILIASALFWLLLTLPVGGVFGLLTTRGLVRRLRQLVNATTRFAAGDYTQRVSVTRPDEVGQLEQHFNVMAAQLVESSSQRQAFAEQNARLGERARLARDLHDSVKQQAFAVSMQLGAALALWDREHGAARQHLEDAETLAYHVQQELTTLIQELRPLALQDKALAPALADYVAAWSRQQGIAATLQLADTGALPPATEEALWRVAQEALSNVARHSHATQVEVALRGEPGATVLVITDNGRGFDPAGVNGAGVGLHSMQERLAALGGRVAVESTVGTGTRVLARCPGGPGAPAVAGTGSGVAAGGRRREQAEGGR